MYLDFFFPFIPNRIGMNYSYAGKSGRGTSVSVSSSELRIGFGWRGGYCDCGVIQDCGMERQRAKVEGLDLTLIITFTTVLSLY